MKYPLSQAALCMLACGLLASPLALSNQVVALDFGTLPGGDDQYSADFGNGFTMTASTHYDVYGDEILLHGNCCADFSVTFEYNNGEIFDFLQVENQGGYWFDISASNGMSAVFEQDYGIKNFGAGWTDLTWIKIGSRNSTYVKGPIFAVASVPVPAAIWLFGSALGLLGWMRRRAV
jgi:hypothetical protein